MRVVQIRKFFWLQVPDPGERWHHASRLQHTADSQRRKQHTHKTRSAVVAISCVFFALTVLSTLVLGVFCRKRNTVFVLQKCEQRDYAIAAAAADDDDEPDDELSTDCESATLPTVVAQTRVTLRPPHQRGDLNLTNATPTTPDLSALFRTSQTAHRNNKTGSASMRREKTLRRSTSWIELDRSETTLSTTLAVECTDDDTDDDMTCSRRVTRDVMSASSLLGGYACSSGLLDVANAAGMFQRSTSLDADVCRRFALRMAGVAPRRSR